MTTLVELCAGTASVSLWALGRAVPLTGYMGSKRRWAGMLVDALGVDAPDQVVLVDAGPWGDVWSVLRDPEQRWRVAAQLDAWSVQDVGDLWDRLVVSGPPADGPAWRTAQFLWLQARAAGTIPIWWSVEHGRWRSPTGAIDAEANMDLAKRTKGRVGRACSKGIAPSVAGVRGWGSGRRTASLIATRIRALDRLPWDRIVVHHTDLRNVPPIPGATVYFDPPYVDSPRYAALCPRADVLRTAQRWSDAGCRVAVSEKVPLVLPEVRMVDGMTGAPLLDGWTSRSLPSAKPEWVTANWPIVLPEQLGLWFGAPTLAQGSEAESTSASRDDVRLQVEVAPGASSALDRGSADCAPPETAGAPWVPGTVPR